MAEEDGTRSEQPGYYDRLQVSTEAIDGVRVVTPAGEIDHHNVQPLSDALQSPQGRAIRTVVDLRRVTFMDSTGINTLLAAYQSHRASGGSLHIAAPSSVVIRLLSMVGIDQVIPCHDTLDSALGA
ncbi:STAS domain-containing protein [Streptomyces zhihengii]|uniref:Anti-sigma factor antagonist n=1 Tax=Streptomyces zhihengii TaxID=1818004 RepID=A0ABS2V4C8_9ACTN|nr:STAS domain-containing protein [Streptomyces zhihengii]MBM9623880.1 STAS domain-containing protein [Streptomyces zhihengii]